MNIIQYLLNLIQDLYQMNCWLISFICKYIPLKQWAFDDLHSPKYQKFKVDELPKLIHYEVWDYNDYIPYIKWRYNYDIKPINRHSECDIDDDCKCPRCNAPKPYLYKIMVPKGRFSARFAVQGSVQTRVVLPKLPHYVVLTATTSLFPKRTVSTSSSINASIQNVHTTLTTSKRLIKTTLRKTTERININSTTSTVNSL